MKMDATRVTQEVAEFIHSLEFDALPAEAVRIGRRCVLDGLGLIVGGCETDCAQIVRRYCSTLSGFDGSSVFGAAPGRFPAPLAAWVNGTAGHAMDWDDTQLSVTPDRIYGLLTHPTMPPLTATLALAEQVGNVSGRDFMLAFLTGFEVECKIAEAIDPAHYKGGFHTSGTIGTFGAAVAAAKLLGLNIDQIRHTIGIAASMASGIRTNFGTMTKPLHVGRAAFNGVSAALLAKDGFEANMDGLDGQWGFFQVLGGGFDPEKISGALGNPHTIVAPGVSIKPYPCGVLTHPSMDAMLALVKEHDVQPDQIKEAVLYAGSNILNPIRYRKATTELEGKFCMSFLLSAIAIARRAGTREFTPEFVMAPVTQNLMDRIRTEFDPEIEAKGWDKIRSRVEITLTDGTKLVREADERYRGGPDNPLSWEEIEVKFEDCTGDIFTADERRKVSGLVERIEQLERMEELVDALRPVSASGSN